MLFHQPGDKVTGAGIAIFIGKKLDLLPDENDNVLMVRYQLLDKSRTVIFSPPISP